MLSQRASEVLKSAEDDEDDEDDDMEVEQSEGDGDDSSASEDDASDLDEEQQEQLKVCLSFVLLRLEFQTCSWRVQGTCDCLWPAPCPQGTALVLAVSRLATPVSFAATLCAPVSLLRVTAD